MASICWYVALNGYKNRIALFRQLFLILFLYEAKL